MARKRHTPEQIIRKLRQAEIELAEGATVEDVCRSLEVTKNTYYRWRREYGGLRVSQARRLKELERENARLPRDEAAAAAAAAVRESESEKQ